jgi:hypothetical protein
MPERNEPSYLKKAPPTKLHEKHAQDKPGRTSTANGATLKDVTRSHQKIKKKASLSKIKRVASTPREYWFTDENGLKAFAKPVGPLHRAFGKGLFHRAALIEHQNEVNRRRAGRLGRVGRLGRRRRGRDTCTALADVLDLVGNGIDQRCCAS